MAGLVLVVAVAAIGGGYGGSVLFNHTQPPPTGGSRPPAAHPTRAPSSLRSLVVTTEPVVRCPTAQGIGGPPPSPYGAAAWTLTLPRRFVGTLAFYTDTQGLMLLLGPRGWACHAGYGADGGGGVDVFPSGTPMFGTAPWVEPRLTEGVTGSQTSACFSCTVDQACPLFPAAALAEIQNYQTACKPHPPQERVTTVGYDAKGFEDPPGVKGNGFPSGGKYPANGVMTYIPATQGNGVATSYMETCTLPVTDHALCTVILNDFLRRYGGE